MKLGSKRVPTWQRCICVVFASLGLAAFSAILVTSLASPFPLEEIFNFVMGLFGLFLFAYVALTGRSLELAFLSHSFTWLLVFIISLSWCLSVIGCISEQRWPSLDETWGLGIAMSVVAFAVKVMLTRRFLMKDKKSQVQRKTCDAVETEKPKWFYVPVWQRCLCTVLALVTLYFLLVGFVLSDKDLSISMQITILASSPIFILIMGYIVTTGRVPPGYVLSGPVHSDSIIG